ncbi:hypothetical protein BWI96_18045 [Siphonobacter sp. SORGH_AS_0500]|nr:hypothetical protein BWI96_18045 [Siphonobacter sp. SORGH_AS_0500]
MVRSTAIIKKSFKFNLNFFRFDTYKDRKANFGFSMNEKLTFPLKISEPSGKGKRTVLLVSP